MNRKLLKFLFGFVFTIGTFQLTVEGEARCTQVEVSKLFGVSNSPITFTPGKALFGPRKCEWRKKIKIPDECNANLIAIDGTGFNPNNIDIVREADGEQRLNRSTSGGVYGWHFEQNNFICNQSDCKESFYRITTTEEKANFACFQLLTVTLELF